MRRLRKTKVFFLFCACLTCVVSVLYGEYLVYYLNSTKWLPVSCKNQQECVRILFVADPQIIGNWNEVFHPITPFSIYDSDRYLKKTFKYAQAFVKPDVIAFLGDLMDEAHIASDEDFYSYIRRIFNIFLDGSDLSKNVKHIWIPGDNDIGGEDTKVTPKKLQRFERAFSQPSITVVKNVTFFKINRLTSIIPVYKKERDFYNVREIFVGLSHVPLMFKPSPFVDKVINKMLPHVLFTAHEHKSMIIKTDALLRQDFHITPVTPENTKIFQFTLGSTDMYEIMVPTCSYRMGTTKIGFGYAAIERNELKFTILWSPSRFEVLAVYLFLFIFFTLAAFCIKCCPKI
ncbi:uncharacterized protein LOC132697898 isoform X1 [Cylas formicarius]|uniref:uncharacterized protein LOC132697898 isoform X1 n=1 Tax=Cylas formicarius TaxID=197179 RepID=UPI0029587F8E|nr:uncharacterized protein LOC132697898 isoform X1 [Cylas formicarius]